NVLAINLIGNPSARRSLRISAQSSTANTPFSSRLVSRDSDEGGQNSGVDTGAVFIRRRKFPLGEPPLTPVDVHLRRVSADNVATLRRTIERRRHHTINRVPALAVPLRSEPDSAHPVIRGDPSLVS